MRIGWLRRVQLPRPIRVIIVTSMRLFGSFLSFLVFAGPALGATFGTVVPIVGGAADIVLDEPRQRLYLVNSSLNQIQIYQTDFSPPRLQTSIRVCHQPISAVPPPRPEPLVSTRR